MDVSKYANEEDKINLFFIGENFYVDSGTRMSSIYEVETKKRWHWGFVQVALDEGYEVNIRQASRPEIQWAKNKLEEDYKNE